MRYGQRRFRKVRKPAKPYVPPTPEQVEARRKAKVIKLSQLLLRLFGNEPDETADYGCFI